MGDCYQIIGDVIQIELKVSPGASKNEFTGVKDKRLCVRIAAQPEDGKANAALCGFLAKTLCCAKRDVVLVKGEKSRLKTITVPVEYNEKLTKINLTNQKRMK
jgi:uncharacterized protein (TIGR00251 family)